MNSTPWNNVFCIFSNESEETVRIQWVIFMIKLGE
ncbi:hypothetical protein SAMN05444342_3702 [Haladaptatus paucihalophilus DX253]|uniref:Uncharacterized protein n=1 Tax=Haladaptatus paucihalophilus DX253 TaxID=797209 RepID=A0A1M7A4X6_HALPU|nr:hypothetical protein SAMN05444342_3702 [Haladaptatus paucihalophilus DX253]